ncbi:MAG: archaeal proteasome endopeptidase complex subunit beta [Candidatus Methanoliparum thermophilum]|uniref:Proteasome subunit beta n=1 Tax=Methanoliparum thermophilum TaxID=2491083 RepID=A0A520KTK5_METT2|nr:archaeal proteasome endopeptidase complex subunit beta [Candidatus Methanoliparum sp. LAM-1]RZN65412.1 MAG: archaeal proteasome endopeptidase complex subunit beta [Candidatus Methanoliparum thermophilum]BDC35499.1 proteasome subunit beta [Candidatus Methanoliparum sp. LAM-1]
MNYNSKEIFKGTTTAGIICKDGIVLGSEKRATRGNFIASKDAQKIYKIDDTIGITTAGGVGDAQRIVRIIRAEANIYKMRNKASMSIKAISTLLSNILNENRYYPYIADLIIGGVDQTGSHLFSVDPVGGMIEEKKAVSTGSGSPIAYGILESGYREGISMNDGVELVVKAIFGAIRRDSGSGENIEVVKIGGEKGLEKVDESVIKDIISNINYY